MFKGKFLFILNIFFNKITNKNNYNYNCKLLANYAIFIDDPDLSRLQKALLYGIVLLVVAFFVAVIQHFLSKLFDNQMFSFIACCFTDTTSD